MDAELQKIKDIIVRTLLEESSGEEQQLLKAWREESEANETFYRKICDTERVAGRMQEYMDLDVSKAFLENQKRLKKSAIRRMIRQSLPYAAILLLAGGIVILWPDEKQQTEVAQTEQEIRPGSRQAELILADGKTVRLKEGMETKIQEGVSKVVIQGNSIHYSEGENTQEIRYNTIRTPQGGEYSVTLSDGTVVWLNAMSELRYPVKFAGKERRVELKGEAYFEVHRDTSCPFLVTSGEYQIQVLGTSFNVSAYNEDALLKTTLCTGKVNIRDLRTAQSVTLLPGKQLNCDKESRKMEIKDVNVQLYTAWTKGEFRFDNTPIEEIFGVLQRWYNIEVFFINQQARQEVFTGKLPRFDNLQAILEIMEKVSDLKFERKGNTLLIK